MVMTPRKPKKIKRIRGIPDAARSFDARLPEFVRGPGREEAARRLRNASVALAACGSVGLSIADTLPRLGIKSMLFSDPASFKAESLTTHPIINPAAICQNKARFAARHAVSINPAMEVHCFEGNLQEVALADLSCYDLLIAATDNVESEYQLGQVSRRLHIPMIRAAVEGTTLTGQVTIYGNSAVDSPCPACLFGPAEFAAIDKGGWRFSCNGETSPQSGQAPTMSIPSLCGITAHLAVQQMVRLSLGLGRSVLDTMLDFSGYINQLNVSRILRCKDCPCDHRPFSRVFVPGKLAGMSIADLLSASGLADQIGLNIEIEGYAYAERAACACGQLPAAGRFVSSEACPACRKSMGQSFYLHRQVTPGMHGMNGYKALGQLGASAARCAIVTSLQRGALVFSERTDRT
jgi:molybdopterin/thiamine biosynthesis adenylyltransferase